MAYTVATQRAEIRVRMALGASSGHPLARRHTRHEAGRRGPASRRFHVSRSDDSSHSHASWSQSSRSDCLCDHRDRAFCWRCVRQLPASAPCNTRRSDRVAQTDLVSWNSGSSHNSRAGHPGSRRCSSLKYARYSRSSRLAIRAPRSGTYATNHCSRTLAASTCRRRRRFRQLMYLTDSSDDRVARSNREGGAHRSAQRYDAAAEHRRTDVLGILRVGTQRQSPVAATQRSRLARGNAALTQSTSSANRSYWVGRTRRSTDLASAVHVCGPRHQPVIRLGDHEQPGESRRRRAVPSCRARPGSSPAARQATRACRRCRS